MPKFAANLTMLYTDSPFLDRFERARASGFRYVEYLFPYEHDIGALAQALAQNGLTQVLFDLPPGDWSAGECGLAAHPDRIDEFRQGIARGVDIAQVLRVRQLNCLAGKWDERIPFSDQRRVLIENLLFAAKALAEQDMTLLIEMLNPYDVPGFVVATPKGAFELAEMVGAPNLKVQYDFYHAQRSEGELTNTFRKNLARIGHVQVADNPGRHQPGTGEINYPFVFRFLDQVGYAGFVGLEYIPEGTTEESLAWVEEYGYEL